MIARLYGGYEDRYIKEFYEGKEFPQDIVDELGKNPDSVILTAGYPQFQVKKIKAIGLGDIGTHVVPAREKPIWLIGYISLLDYIPAKVKIYDDTIKYRLQYLPKIKEVFE